MPWDYRPWGCGSGSKGSCNSGWMQFEICEDNLTNKEYFDAAYKEACEITAYYCKMYNIDPKGTVVHEGVTVPTILCHYDSYKLGLGSNHGDVDHWFKKHGKTMDNVREDVAKLLAEDSKADTEQKTESQTQQFYRVRKTWADAKSQKGAFTSLENAKSCCDTAGEGYKVFDWNGTEVYAYTAPVKEPVIQVAVYDLDYPNKVKIVDNTIQRTNMDCAKAINKILSNNPEFNIEIAKAFFKLAPRYQIDPLMAVAQSILETGWFKYSNSAVTPDQHNYCGMGVVTNGIKGASFNTIEDGVTAQLQHLFAYGCKEPLPENEVILDPRFSLVTRGIAQYWQQLAGRWACPGYDTTKYATPTEAMAADNTYGQKILRIYNQLLAASITEEEAQKYFEVPHEEQPPEIEEVPEASEKEDEEAKTTNLAKLIFEVIKKLVQMFANLFTKN